MPGSHFKHYTWEHTGNPEALPVYQETGYYKHHEYREYRKDDRETSWEIPRDPVTVPPMVQMFVPSAPRAAAGKCHRTPSPCLRHFSQPMVRNMAEGNRAWFKGWENSQNRLGHNEKMRWLRINPGRKYPQFEVIYCVHGIMTQPEKRSSIVHFLSETNFYHSDPQNGIINLSTARYAPIRWWKYGYPSHRSTVRYGLSVIDTSLSKILWLMSDGSLPNSLSAWSDQEREYFIGAHAGSVLLHGCKPVPYGYLLQIGQCLLSPAHPDKHQDSYISVW